MQTFSLLTLALLTAAAQTPDDDALVAYIDCEECLCLGPRKPNCTNHCHATGIKSGDSFDKFKHLLLEIGPLCQIRAEVIVAQQLRKSDWCVTTTSGRDGFIVTTPSLADEDLSVVNTEVLDMWIRVWHDNWSCNEREPDGYYVYPTNYSANENFCPMESIPANLVLHQPTLGVNTLKIGMSTRELTQEFLEEHQIPPANNDVNAKDSFILRYYMNGRADGDHCYSPSPHGFTLFRFIRGYYNGVDYPIHMREANDADDLKSVWSSETRYHRTAWTMSQTDPPRWVNTRPGGILPPAWTDPGW